jgi:hypothetical protein
MESNVHNIILDKNLSPVSIKFIIVKKLFFSFGIKVVNNYTSYIKGLIDTIKKN